jgi:hypothetical protein
MPGVRAFLANQPEPAVHIGYLHFDDRPFSPLSLTPLHCANCSRTFRFSFDPSFHSYRIRLPAGSFANGTCIPSGHPAFTARETCLKTVISLAGASRLPPHLVKSDPRLARFQTCDRSAVLNDLDPDGLADAIRNAKAGKAVINSRVGARPIMELRNRHDEPVNAFYELTDREMDVLRQIGAGKNNHEIAAALVISEKTVKAHVANFLTARRLPCLPGKKASCGAI